MVAFAARGVAGVQDCECCGCGARVFAVKVRSRKNAAVTTTLHLCSRCVEGEDRTWRLMWERER
jgi:hypothetical protein